MFSTPMMSRPDSPLLVSRKETPSISRHLQMLSSERFSTKEMSCKSLQLQGREDDLQRSHLHPTTLLKLQGREDDHQGSHLHPTTLLLLLLTPSLKDQSKFGYPSYYTTIFDSFIVTILITPIFHRLAKALCQGKKPSIIP